MLIIECKRTMQHISSINLALTLALLIGICISGAYGNGTPPAWVLPGVAEVAVGSDLNITCTINKAFFDSRRTNESCVVQDLYFKANVTGVTRIFRGSDLININDTTILLPLKNLPDHHGEYQCMCKEMIMYYSHVYVGTEPIKVNDFNCTSYDWDYMFCNFTAPWNAIATNYSLRFKTDKLTGYGYYVDCNFDALPVVNCNITGEQYKKFAMVYYFTLNINNSLGNVTQDIWVNNVERMILARPGQNLRQLNRTKDSVCLSWEMPRRSNYNGGVLWYVNVTPENFGTLMRPMWRNNSSAARDTLCLTELPYPGYNYQLELRVRNNKSQSRWSPPLIYNFRTASERPARPPRITDGSFYVYSTGTSLTIYWEQLLKHELNGDNFTYVISEYRVNGTLDDASKVKVYSNSATIDNYRSDAYHEIYIRSSNNVNTSVEASRFFIPIITEEDGKTRVPGKVQGVYHSNNSSYTLDWKPPTNISELVDYTVFWCNATPPLLSRCNGSIHFEHVPLELLQYRTATGQSPSLNMAVSANYVDRNTGMHWVVCTGDGNDDLVKMDPTIDEVTNTSLTVKWGTERVCAAILSGYNLTYCQRPEGKVDNCTTKELPRDLTSYKIVNLEPYTYYSIKMSMYSLKRASKYSDELIERTAPGVPTPPQELRFYNVTNSRVVLVWKPPAKANGMLREYRGSVTHDNKTSYFYRATLTSDLSVNEMQFELDNLMAYTDYEITMRAQTILYSEPSNAIRFRTKVGEPSAPTALRVTNTPDSTTLEWMPPQRPAGLVEYYEVAIIEHNDNNTIVGQPISYIRARANLTCEMVTPICRPLHRFHYQVRAVNVEPLDEYSFTENIFASRLAPIQECVSQPPFSDREWSAILSYNNISLYRVYKSPWTMHEVSCSPNASSIKMLVSSVEVVTALIVIGAFLFMAYRKIQKMSDIDLVLPPGIAETRKKPIESGGIGGGYGGNGGGGVGSIVGGIICTHIDSVPHSGNESSKLLLENSSSGGIGGGGGGNGLCNDREAKEERTVTKQPQSSYIPMSHDGLLLDVDSHTGATELHPHSPDSMNISADASLNHNPNADANAGGYIKPTQMKNWPTPSSNTLPSLHGEQMHQQQQQQPQQPPPLSMQFNGYVPVQVLLAPPAPAPVAAPMHLLNTSNYVQASDLHKLKPLAPMAMTAPAATQPTPPTATPLIPDSYGYTAMEQLLRNGMMKPTVPLQQSPAGTAGAPATPHHTTQQMPHRLQPNIGGYVTPQDLNALAHNRHML